MINAEDFDNFDDFDEYDDFDSEVFHQIYIHAILYTKDRQKTIDSYLEHELYALMQFQFDGFECEVIEIGGMQDHVHVLFKMGVDFSLNDILEGVMQFSEENVREKKLALQKFEWDSGFAAFSEDMKSLPITEKYIQLQYEHHKNKTTDQELNEFLIMHGLENDEEGFNKVSLN